MSYCYKCGAPRIEVETEGFSTHTGKRLTKEVCSKNPCHSGHEKHSYSFLECLAHGGAIGYCKVCGEQINGYEGV